MACLFFVVYGLMGEHLLRMSGSGVLVAGDGMRITEDVAQACGDFGR